MFSCVELRLSLAKVWVKLKHLKYLIKVFEVYIEVLEAFNRNISSLVPFHYFPGWVGGWEVGGWVAVLNENKNNSASIEIEVELS